MESLSEETKNSRGNPLKCKFYSAIEGWIVFVSGIHTEAQEDDVLDLFSEYGKVKNMHLNQDRRTGSIKGYALIEYEELDFARQAISHLNNKDYLGKRLSLDFAFKNSS